MGTDKGKSMNDQIDYRAVRRRVADGVKTQKQLANGILFGVNLLLFVLFLIIAFAIYLSSDSAAGSLVVEGGRVASNDAALGALIMLSAGWLTSLIFHGVSIFMNTRAGEQQMRDRAIARELGRELLRLGEDGDEFGEKRKRVMALTDDGELAEDLDDEAIALEELLRKQQSGL
jgi:hypothetical protein